MSAPITIAGGLTRDPELRFTKDGKPVASFSVVTSRRFLDKSTNEWTDADTSFWDVSAFGKLAENICESCVKGTRVIVTGNVKQESYTTKDGDKRTAVRVTADDVAVSVKWKTVQAKEAAPAGTRGSFNDEVPF